MKYIVVFAMSDEKEWNAILSAGAVRILCPQESDEVRRETQEGSSRVG